MEEWEIAGREKLRTLRQNLFLEGEDPKEECLEGWQEAWKRAVQK